MTPTRRGLHSKRMRKGPRSVPQVGAHPSPRAVHIQREAHPIFYIISTCAHHADCSRNNGNRFGVLSCNALHRCVTAPTIVFVLALALYIPCFPFITFPQSSFRPSIKEDHCIILVKSLEERYSDPAFSFISNRFSTIAKPFTSYG